MSKDGYIPGRAWRWLRRLTQSLAFVALIMGPFLGGWQRLDRADLATWDSEDAELPLRIRDTLPTGAAPGHAYEINRLLGGGIAVDYLSIPILDPVAGALSLLSSPASGRMLLAWVLPFLLAIVAGRVFCGWFCPFGTLSRVIRGAMDRMPWRRRFTIPDKRPLRWVLLGVALCAGLFGMHLLLYLSLPHFLVQQSIYAAWLLGGGSTVLGVLAGLVFAGLVFGPTTYCATLCPTGAVLGGVSARRLVHLRIADPSRCGKTCEQCARGCWLALDPDSGDPGLDCDLCGRCTQACPRTNLRIGFRKGELKPSKVAIMSAFVVLALVSQHAAAQIERKPELLLSAERIVGDVTAALSIIDMRDVKVGIDSEQRHTEIELSVFIARGERGEADERGLLPPREVYKGPLSVRFRTAEAKELAFLEFTSPNSPTSTPRRSIYRRRLDLPLATGDEVTLLPVEDWIDQELSWTVPPQGVDGSRWLMLGFVFASALAFTGLLSIALAFRDDQRTEREPKTC